MSENIIDSVKRNHSLQIPKWLTLLAGISVWRWNRSVSWTHLTRVKLALVVGIGCIIALLVTYSLGVKNLIVARKLTWLIPYVVLILGLAMRTSRVFRIAMLTAILLASPYLSLMTTIWGACNNVLVRYAVCHRRAGEVMVFNDLRTVGLPDAWQAVLNVPHFRHNEPGVVIIEGDVRRFLHTLLWADTMPWGRIWLFNNFINERQELERYLGNGRPVRFGNHTVRYLRSYRAGKFEHDMLDLYYIIIEPSDASDGEDMRYRRQR